jgi:hypothetical protein
VHALGARGGTYSRKQPDWRSKTYRERDKLVVFDWVSVLGCHEVASQRHLVAVVEIKLIPRWGRLRLSAVVECFLTLLFFPATMRCLA